MAAGDFVVRRNNANVDTIANTSGDLTLIWDTAVANQGSGITHSAGTFTLGETGHFLIMWSDAIRCTDPDDGSRIGWESRITFAGSDIIAGSCTGHSRQNGLTEEYIVQGFAVVSVTTTTGNGDEFFIHHIRDDNTVASPLPLRIAATRSGVTIIKLDDTFGYGRYTSSASVTASVTDNAATTLNIQTTAEEDSPFTRSTNSVDIATTNAVLVLFTARLTTQNTANRAESQIRLNLNAGTIVPGSWNQVYGPRNSDDLNKAAMSGMCIIYPSSGDDLIFEIVSRELGGDDWEAALTLIELPSGTESCTVEATTGLFNESTAAVFAWDTNPHIDTAAFTHTTGNSNIEVDNADDYIVMANQAVTADAGLTAARAVPSMQFRVNTTNDETAGATTYHRSTQTADHGAIMCGTLLTGLSAEDDIHVWNDSTFSQTTGTLVCQNGAFTAIRLSSLFAVAGGRIMSSLVRSGGLAGAGGIAGQGGGLAA